jgi:hypothetical protein
MKKFLIGIIILLLCLNAIAISFIVSISLTTKIEQPVPISHTQQIKVAFIGDQGISGPSEVVLNLIKQEQAQVILNQGDFDYANDPQAWDSELSRVLGPTFPQLATLGNHDMEKKSEYEQKIAARIHANPLFSCTGTLGEKAICRYKNISIVSIAPGLVPADYGSYIDSAFAPSTDTWKICAWHMNQHLLQTGEKTDEVGWDVYNYCLKAGAMIVTGHEHSYERTFLLDAMNPPHVVSSSTTLALGPGKSFVVVSGLGGESIRPQLLINSWWASTYSSNQHANYGALFCTFNIFEDTHRAHCYFKDIDGHLADSFDISR